MFVHIISNGLLRDRCDMVDETIPWSLPCRQRVFRLRVFWFARSLHTPSTSKRPQKVFVFTAVCGRWLRVVVVEGRGFRLTVDVECVGDAWYCFSVYDYTSIRKLRKIINYLYLLLGV